MALQYALLPCRFETRLSSQGFWLHAALMYGSPSANRVAAQQGAAADAENRTAPSVDHFRAGAAEHGR